MINKQYISSSLELHLFFGRIMKEHSLFLEAAFTPRNSDLAKIADQYKVQFEIALLNAVQLANNVINPDILASGEIVTNYTLLSEQKTQNFTGININQEITRQELRLLGNHNPQVTQMLFEHVKQLNSKIMLLLNGLIDFKTKLLQDVNICQVFTLNYPLLIEHILREAKMYQSHLLNLENGKDLNHNLKDTELFWDQIMMEHAMFIRGLLDPTENQLIDTAHSFATDYQKLLEEARKSTEMTINSIIDKTIQKTSKFKQFKEAGTKGLVECKIKSIILPLLADHVLRESNHYLRLLNMSKYK